MSIEERLARLEKGARWWRRVALVCCAAVAVVLFAGQGRAGQDLHLSLESLTIVDSNGVPKAEFAVNKGNDLAFLCLHGEKGKPGRGAAIQFPPAYLSPSRLVFSNFEGPGTGRVARFGFLKTRILEGNPTLAGMDIKEGLAFRARMGLEADGSPSITLNDGRQRKRVVLKVRGNRGTSKGTLAMYDEDGHAIWRAPR